MPLTPENEETLTTMFIAWYKHKYGDQWKQNFHKNMRPSPVNQWSQFLGVSVADIYTLKQSLVCRYASEEFDAHYEPNF